MSSGGGFSPPPFTSVRLQRSVEVKHMEPLGCVLLWKYSPSPLTPFSVWKALYAARMTCSLAVFLM